MFPFFNISIRDYVTMTGRVIDDFCELTQIVLLLHMN